MSKTEERNDKGPDKEESIPTANMGGSTVAPGSQIGPYKLLSILGEGGFGVVYLAERQRPVKRRVALKVIKPGMDTKQVIARFEAERQALALLEHPNIAHVFNAGTTDAGRPYFVMEYVKGVPITEHCDRHKLTIEERLNLFLQVCEAVQYAHQKGIIHRDIKPSNVQVSIHGEQVVPKVIDFGVVKAISQPLTERTLVTEQGQFIGTPEYMSPEQAEMTGQDVDTRSDIYSLGVVLYELLTGVLPFEAKILREGGIDHIRKVIREEDPKTPSTRLSTLGGEESTRLAQHRRIDPGTLRRRLRGDLDWITLKAMEKDRIRRYQTAHALDEDIQRHLAHEPVLAGPPSKIYRLKKLLRKYRTQAIAAATAAVLLACIAVICVMYVQAINRGKEAESLKHRDTLSKAMELRSNGQFQEALAKVETIVDSEHVGPKAHLLRVRLVLELQGPAAAVKELQKLLNERDEIACQAHFLLARIYLESDPGDLETTEEYQQKAKGHQQKGEGLFSESAEAYFNRSMMAGTVNQTLEWLNKAIDFDPGHYDSREARALTYYALRDYRNMERDAVAIITLKGWDSLGYSLMAIALRGTDNFADAVEYHIRAIKITPAEPELYNQRRQTYMQMGNYEQALLDARKCAELEPEEGIYHFHSFCALVALGRYDEAKVKYDNIIESGLMTKENFDLSASKYVSDTLDAGLSWYPPQRRPEGDAFLAMHESAEIYEQLAKKARRVVAEGYHANWSPDGSQLVYSRGILGFTGIEIINLESGKTRLLTVPGFDPAWSPDGNHIVYVRSRQTLLLTDLTAERAAKGVPHEQREVWIINADGTQEPRFLARGAWPSWSRDSKRVFYHSPKDMKVCSISIEDGAKPTPIIQFQSGSPVVSPDEKYVAYYRGRLRIVELASKSVIASWMAPFAQGWGFVNWSPNGQELSMAALDNSGLWIYDVKKKKASKVLSGSFGWCSWSAPDISKIAIGRVYGAQHHEIWVANLDPNVSAAQALGPGGTSD
jgi:serine/threonine protein kinase/Tol biopolymer transport system component